MRGQIACLQMDCMFKRCWNSTLLGGWNNLSVRSSLQQAVPYSREFKQKYDYFRKKLKKPVSGAAQRGGERRRRGGCQRALRTATGRILPEHSTAAPACAAPGGAESQPRT